MRRDTSKNCFCHTCCKELNSMGLARHRAMHRDKKEDCLIENSNGETKKYRYSETAENAENKND